MSTRTLFQKIHEREVPARFLHEDEHCFVIEDIDPQAPRHVLVIPIRPIPSLADVGPDDGPIMVACLLAANRVARELGLDAGWRLVANVGVHGGQSVPHLHFHVLGGRPLGWPPG